MPSVNDVELVIVTMSFATTRPEELGPVLARYVVLARGEAGCLNVDLMVSALDRSRFTVVEKWDGHSSQRRHFDSPAMVEMATSVGPLLEAPPVIDLHDAISAHDLH